MSDPQPSGVEPKDRYPAEHSDYPIPVRRPCVSGSGSRPPRALHGTAVESSSQLRRDTRMRSARRDGLTFSVLAAGVFAFSLLQAVSVPTLPLLQSQFHSDHVTASWTLTVFLLAATVTTPIFGRLGDLFGTRRMFVWSLLALCFGSLLAAASPSIGMLIAARAVQGLGAATLPLSFALIRDQLHPERVAGAISLIASLLASGFALGIVLCGPVIDNLGFRWLFAFPALIAGGAAAVTLLVVTASDTRTAVRVPVLPSALLAGWLITLLLAVTKAPQWGWQSPTVWGLIATAMVVALCWARVEWVARTPLIDLRLMARRGVWTANLTAMAIGIASYGWFTLLPQFNQTPAFAGYGFGASVSESGHLLLPAALTSLLCGLLAARLAGVIAVSRVVVAGCVLTAAGLAMAAALHDHSWQIGVAAALCGLGSGLSTACLANAVVLAVAPQHTAVATGMNANFRTLGGTLGTAATSAILTNSNAQSGIPLVGAYVTVFAVLAAAALCGAAAAASMPAGNR